MQHQDDKQETSDKKPEGLVETQAAFDDFVAKRTEEGYKALLSTFVFEVMSTERCAELPTSAENLNNFLAGKAPFASTIIRDNGGAPYLVFLTDPSMNNNGAESLVSYKASAMLESVMSDNTLSGIAINPWNGGGAALPKNLLFEEIRKIHDQVIGNDNESEDNMTVNMSAYEELRKRILAAGGEELVTIKKDLAGILQSQNFQPRNGEDATGAWNLYLDVLCDIRLGAVAWDGGKVVTMDARELDLLADWYECLCEVARSVNRRQKDGRGGCNFDKYKALETFIRDNQAAIEKIMNGNYNRYVSYLLERTQQIVAMHDSGQWRRIEKVDTLRGTYFC